MNRITPANWFQITATLFFISFICFINVNSTWADENNYNTHMKVAGVVFLVLSGLALYKTKKVSN